MVEDEPNGTGLPGQISRLVVPYEQKALQAPERILKADVGVMPIWLGSRLYDNSDLEKFRSELMWARFGQYSAFELPGAYDLKDQDPYPVLAPVDYDLRRVLTNIDRPLVIFIITTKEVAELPWVIDMTSGLMEVRRQANKKNTFVYKAIMGGFNFQKDGPEDPTGHFSRSATRAHELGGVLLPYHTDYLTPCTRRLVEFMNRVVGTDLPGEEFPNYSDEEIRKIAWHINKESFNSFYEKEGAIPKYPIENGRPVFAF